MKKPIVFFLLLCLFLTGCFASTNDGEDEDFDYAPPSGPRG